MKRPILEIRHMNVGVRDKQILFDISCSFEAGKITVLMGPNGSGKSTFARVLMGDPVFPIQKSGSGDIVFFGKNITSMEPEKRAKMGLFLSFQSPIAIPGVSVRDILRAQYRAFQISAKTPFVAWNVRIHAALKKLQIDPSFLDRSIHEEFSGGERKKIELLQALLIRPALAVFDEIDTGVDVDALQVIAGGIRELQKDHVGIVLITHGERLFRYLKADRVLVMKNGRIVEDGTDVLMKKISKAGYTHL